MGLTQEVVERRLMDFESNVKDAIRSPVCRREKKRNPTRPLIRKSLSRLGGCSSQTRILNRLADQR